MKQLDAFVFLDPKGEHHAGGKFPHTGPVYYGTGAKPYTAAIGGRELKGRNGKVREFKTAFTAERAARNGQDLARYRVVYGETLPAWERICPTLAEARAFAAKQVSLGDVVFSIRKVIPGEGPQSLQAAIEAAQ